MRCVSVIPLSLLLLFTLLTGTVQAANQDQAIGVNINAIRNWISSVPFVDLFKSSRPFADTAGVTFDAQGWPEGLPVGTSLGSVVIDPVITPALPTGNYVVRYSGDGTLQYNGNVTVVETSQGRDVLGLNPAAGNIYLEIEILESNPQDPLRDIHMTLPGGICISDPYTRVDSTADCSGDYQSFEDHASTIIFNPDFLRYVKDFRVLRLMDFMETNGSTVTQWSDRTHLNDATWWTPAGAPIEIMVELANRANAYPWFNMPHMANDNFNEQFAAYIRDHLDVELKAYVEYTNEAWNGNLQGGYMNDQGEALNLHPNRYTAGLKYYSQRSIEVFNIWETQFGGTERLVRILAGQQSNTWRTDQILKHNDAYLYTDAFALNPYISGDSSAFNAASTVDDIFAEMYNPESNLSLPTTLTRLAAHKAITDQYSVDLFAYEAGQHLVDFTTSSVDVHPNPLFLAANHDPRMGVLYEQLLDGWKDNGGQFLIHYSAPRIYNHHGSWGTSEYINQTRNEAPKYAALLTFMENTPCWWPGCANTAGNLPPVADAQAVNATEETALAIVLSASDPENDALSYLIVDPPVNGVLTETADNDANLIYTPNANYAGADSFSFKVNDGSVDSAVAVVSITVNPVANHWQFISDYRSGIDGSASGWSFHWNENGPIGTASSYSDLIWNGTKYNSNGLTVRPTLDELRYGQLTVVGGHPGQGVNQGVADDRYVIAAYQVVSSGSYRISNSALSQVACSSSTGLDARIYVNDNLMQQQMIAPGGALFSLDVTLNNLLVGDTIYVAVGPDGRDGCDGFALVYGIDGM